MKCTSANGNIPVPNQNISCVSRVWRVQDLPFEIMSFLFEARLNTTKGRWQQGSGNWWHSKIHIFAWHRKLSICTKLVQPNLLEVAVQNLMWYIHLAQHGKMTSHHSKNVKLYCPETTNTILTMVNLCLLITTLIKSFMVCPHFLKWVSFTARFDFQDGNHSSHNGKTLLSHNCFKDENCNSHNNKICIIAY